MTKPKTIRKNRKPVPWTPEIEAIFREKTEMANTSLGRFRQALMDLRERMRDRRDEERNNPLTFAEGVKP